MPSTHIHKTCRLLLAAAIMAMTGIITSSCFHTMHAHPEAINNNPDAVHPDPLHGTIQEATQSNTIAEDKPERIVRITQARTSTSHESGGTVQNNSASGDINAGKPNQTQQDHQANLIVTIDWQDDENRDGLRPDQVKLSLLANGTVAARKAVTEKESWKCVFTGLPLRDKNNEPILYRVAENTIPGYSISQRKTEPAQSSSLLSCRNTSYIILNHREPSTTSVTVKTSWNDSMDHEKLRPKQTKVQLYANGIPYGGKRILDSSNGWKCHFKDLPVNTGGNRISYTAAQEWVPDGYQESLSADENGTILIENQHNAGESVSDDSSDMTSLSGYVKWDDADDQDSLRPFELEINLQANGKQIARKKVSAADGWTFSFDSLPKYTNGSEISYSVHAAPPSSYEVSEEGSSLLCTHDPETTGIQGKVEWKDEDLHSSLRPGSVTFTLLADGMPLKSIKVKEQDKWAFSVSGLPRYKTGKEVVYTIEPESCAGYEPSVQGTDITFTQIPSSVLPEESESEPRPESEPEAAPGTDMIPVPPKNPATFLPLFPVFFLFLASTPAFAFRRMGKRHTTRQN